MNWYIEVLKNMLPSAVVLVVRKYWMFSLFNLDRGHFDGD